MSNSDTQLDGRLFRSLNALSHHVAKRTMRRLHRLGKGALLLLFMVVYITAGAAVMSHYEHWPYLHALQFCTSMSIFPTAAVRPCLQAWSH